jgi:gluconolactonase
VPAPHAETQAAINGFSVRERGGAKQPLKSSGHTGRRREANDMNRRSFLASSAAGATTAATAGIASAAQLTPPGETAAPIPYGERLPLGPLPGSRYPDTHIEALDAKRFKGSPGTGAVERVATGLRWAEGPAYCRAGHYLIVSDIPNNR